MKFTFEKKTNLKAFDKYWVIVAISTRTKDGIHEAEIYDIDWNNEEVIFNVKQPCRHVFCSFRAMNNYVFTNKKEAEAAKAKLNFGDGCFAYYE